MKHVAFATSSAWPELTRDDRLAAEAVRARGMRVSPAVWSDSAVAWSVFDAIVIRSTWDYHRRFAEFNGWIGALEHAGCTVWNPCRLLRWNANKRYLADLAERGVPIVPTAWMLATGGPALGEIMDVNGWDEVVVKPTISATAHGMRRVRRGDAESNGRIGDSGPGVELLVQPLVHEIATAGEWSVVFFGDTFSHSVRKRPVAGDFRVQEEFGGSSVAEPAPSHVIAAAQAVLAAVTEPWLYARVDGVETSGGFLLMELEMLEPLLFFELEPAAPPRFAEAMVTRLGVGGPV